MIARIAILLTTLALLSFAATAQDKSKTVDFAGQTWEINANKAELVTFYDRPSLHLRQGRVWLNNAVFTNGVIEFDVAYDDNTGFIGFMWRAEDRNKYEEIYFRSHLSGKPDGVQYTPVENKNSAWQIFTNANAVGKIDESFTDWNHVKLVVKDDKADLYFNSNTPVLHIPDMKTNSKSGEIGLRSNVGGGNKKSAYFSNFSYRALTAEDTLPAGEVEAVELPAGLIHNWNISTNIKEDDIKTVELGTDVLSKLKWQKLGAETNGILNLSKIANRSRSDNTVLVKLNIISDTEQMKELRFGYSDRVRLFVNGNLTYSGVAGFRSRDHRFYGTVGPFDTVVIDLKEGNNEIIAAVSENIGGWAFMGAIADQSGLAIIGQD